MFLSANLLSAAILSAVVPFAFAMSFTVSPGLTTCTPLPSSLPGLLPSSLPGLLPSSLPGLLPSSLPGLLPSSLPGFCCLPLLVLEHRLAFSFC